VKDGDLLTNKVHRHEPPVSLAPPKVVADTDDFYVVDKPCSLPIHPVSQYRHNSLIFLLAREFAATYHVVHRLDRLTSGLVLFAKTKSVSQRITREITERKVQKEYIARVKGRFPDGQHNCKAPIFTLSPRKGIMQVAITAEQKSRSKPSETDFELMYFDAESNESLVRARPKTGRTHQIRLHLQYLGFPIVNDPIYNDPVFGSERFEWEKQKELSENDVFEGIKETRGWGDTMYKIDKANGETEGAKDPICEKCRHPPADPEPKDLILFLHALKYTGPAWSFETELPDWARKEYTRVRCYEKYN